MINRKSRKKNRGFTLAELMAVIAIIAILAALGFVAISHYWRILKQMEFDSIAKEIFISAQNHISMVDNESYLGSNSFGTPENAGDPEGNYYYVVGSDKSILNGNNALSLMLPFASIDETVRQGGSYIIRYHKQSARILDVFYSTPSSRFGHTFTDSEYTDLISNYRSDEHKLDRRRYGTDQKVIGYYGGEEANTLNYIDDLPEPELIIENAERLKAKITNADAIKAKYPDAKLRIIVSGLKSGKSRYIDLDLSANTEYVLDSITESGMHFYDLFCNGEHGEGGHTEIKGSDNLIPGENITVQAKVFVDSSLCKLAFSDKKGTNSIFGDETTNVKADINNIRHLENLDPEVSKFANNTITAAEQSADMAWDTFKTNISASDVYVYKPGEKNKQLTAAGKYYPVQMPANIISYNGMSHKISKIDANANGSVGLFSIASNKTITNLELVDFNIAATGDNGYGGALAGRISGTTVENVSVHDDTDISLIEAYSYGGGLVGAAEGSSKIKYSLASVLVQSTSYAGGLVGHANNAEINLSYSGGHTKNGKYEENNINVVATTGHAGGLVGYASSTTINSCYSTCSSDGKLSAGAFVGYSTNSTIGNCYATGYVKASDDSKTDKGGFIGVNVGGSPNSCWYLIISNNNLLTAIGNLPNNTSVKAIDENTQKYQEFISLLANAKPYDQTLRDHFKGKYLYQSIEKLSGSIVASNYFVDNHVGDWADYQSLIIN